MQIFLTSRQALTFKHDRHSSRGNGRGAPLEAMPATPFFAPQRAAPFHPWRSVRATAVGGRKTTIPSGGETRPSPTVHTRRQQQGNRPMPPPARRVLHLTPVCRRIARHITRIGSAQLNHGHPRDLLLPDKRGDVMRAGEKDKKCFVSFPPPRPVLVPYQSCMRIRM
jgi:hypothetical protein